MSKYTKIQNTFIEDMFSDSRNVKPETFMAGCLLFGIMITILLVYLMSGRKIGG